MSRRASYFDLCPDDRDRIHDWLRLHRIEPDNTPIDADIRYDPALHEWVIPQFSTKDGSKYLRDGEVAMHVIRRAVKASLPWPAADEEVPDDPA